MYLALSGLSGDAGGAGVHSCLKGQVAAVSVGIVDGEVVCDLDYDHDSRAEVDMNVVKMGGRFVEIQGTGEKNTFTSDQLSRLIASAEEGLEIVRGLQLEAVGLPPGFTFGE